MNKLPDIQCHTQHQTFITNRIFFNKYFSMKYRDKTQIYTISIFQTSHFVSDLQFFEVRPLFYERQFIQLIFKRKQNMLPLQGYTFEKQFYLQLAVMTYNEWNCLCTKIDSIVCVCRPTCTLCICVG